MHEWAFAEQIACPTESDTSSLSEKENCSNQSIKNLSDCSHENTWSSWQRGHREMWIQDIVQVQQFSELWRAVAVLRVAVAFWLPKSSEFGMTFYPETNKKQRFIKKNLKSTPQSKIQCYKFGAL